MKIEADTKELQYSGRIDFTDRKAPVFVYAGTFVKIRFVGKAISVLLKNHHSYYENRMGYLLDGKLGEFLLDDSDECNIYPIANHLTQEEHELLLYKRMDACHYVSFMGFELNDGAKIAMNDPLPNRRIEVFGDSVSCGEVSEAIDYVAKGDPENHNGKYSNSWYSYSWITARKLNAEIHISSQGGIALFDNTGWFCGPNYIGLESIYDKIQYNPSIGPMKQWDFANWIPHVVVLAFGQNDNNPYDYMKESYDSDKSKEWRNAYKEFVLKLLSLYPGVNIILTTTILNHDSCWDRAIEDICNSLDSKQVHHFLYSKNGCGTPGHIRIPEAEEMAEELTAYIESLGDIWNDESY